MTDIMYKFFFCLYTLDSKTNFNFLIFVYAKNEFKVDRFQGASPYYTILMPTINNIL